MKLLVINPGSTSTKIAVYENEVRHSGARRTAEAHTGRRI